MDSSPKKEKEVYETEDVEEPAALGQVFNAKKPTEVHTDNSTLDSSTVPAREAFLKFQRDALDEDEDRSRFFHRTHALNARQGPQEAAPEDPLSKYNRLQAELADLRTELEGLASQDTQSKDIFTVIKAQEATELSAGARVLQTQLEQLGKTQAFQSFLAPTFDGQSTIASQQLLQKIKELQAGDGEAGGGGSSGKTGKEAGAGGITYELFFNKALQKEAAHSSLNALENRLYELEQVVGLKSLDTLGAAGQPAPLSAVITKLEDRVRLLDPKTLARLQQKMELLNKEFENFTAQAAGIKGGRVELGEDILRERVDKLFSTVQQWAPVADTIPTLIGRMQTLKTLHEESALFSQRLFSLETMQDGLQKMLQADEKALSNVQKKHF
eukprot:INCI1767.2.p1 GENE.INCI1767.2~~INCI1767.2.p1  ORF type:complete len:385 (-),score=99.69 INCI1767.2:173-1327(-)